MSAEAATTPPAMQVGLAATSFDPGFRENPHEILDKLRESGAVVQDTVIRRYLVSQAEAVEAVLRDRELCVDPRKAPPDSFLRMLNRNADEQPQGTQSMLFLDPPDHDRLRGLVNKAFTPKAVDRMAPRIQEIADELLDKLAAKPGFDLIAEFSAPLPTIVIAEMLGVDPKDQARFKAWSDAIIISFNPLMNDEQRKALEAARDEMNAYLRHVIAERRASPREDLISGMVAAEEAGDFLSDDEIVTMISLLLLAGNLTTTDLIGNGVLALLKNPEQLQKLRDDPSLITNAVEEMLRFDPPVTQSGRIVVKDTSVAGCPIPAGSSISPLLLAANHDPAFNPDPHRFDITRAQVSHVSFGGGRRYCLGAPLARLEARIAVLSLVQRIPNLRLAEQKLEYRAIPAFRGLARLDVLT
ncbi:MAG: cytochrome P450 [Dehalococcoidia bacterium]